MLDEYFGQFLAICFPAVHCEIDWSKGYKSKDKELQKLLPESTTGTRIVDKLVRVYRKSGEEAWILIHVEVQNQPHADFPERMFVYHYRIRDRYNRPVVSLAVLGDETKTWRPDRYDDELCGCSVHFRFPIVKLLDFRDREEEFQTTSNPFGLLIVAHLKSLETAGDPANRFEWKLRLVKALYVEGRSGEQVRKLFRFIDWLIDLPPELDQQLTDRIIEHERKNHVPYVTSVERHFIEQGIEQGIERGLRTGIRAILELRFPGDSEALSTEIDAIQSSDQLTKILEASKTIESAQELRQFMRELG